VTLSSGAGGQARRRRVIERGAVYLSALWY